MVSKQPYTHCSIQLSPCPLPLQCYKFQLSFFEDVRVGVAGPASGADVLRLRLTITGPITTARTDDLLSEPTFRSHVHKGCNHRV